MPTELRLGPALTPDFYRRDAAVVARELLGCLLVRELDDESLVLRIVETEAYLGAPDRASHAWNGRRTARNAALYLAGGHAYVYFIYGMHFCLNVVTGDETIGSAVLLRAGEPLTGVAAMRYRRHLDGRPGGERAGMIAGGPGRLAQALAIDRSLDGIALDRVPLWLAAGQAPPREAEIVVGPRIGVAYAGEAAAWPLRFALRDSRHVSRPWPWR
jgi:DNA-3-methyladenine glycosylase